VKVPGISYSLRLDEYREAWIYARYKHVGGRHPESAWMKLAAFDLMKKYKIPEVERAKLEKMFDEEVLGPGAVQPELLEKEP
jgi:hypothetical protein